MVSALDVIVNSVTHQKRANAANKKAANQSPTASFPMPPWFFVRDSLNDHNVIVFNAGEIRHAAHVKSTAKAVVQRQRRCIT
jgi:hypothetical protein